MAEPTGERPYGDDQIWQLVKSLNSLHEGDLGVAMLVACGEPAVSLLRQVLLRGKPGTIAKPRQRVVQALAELGAKEVLLEYLRTPRQIADPLIQLGEEAVENTACRALAQWQTEDVFCELLYFAERRPLAGALEALAVFRRPEGIPYFVRALGDDIGYRPAEEALRALGETVWPALIDAARTPDPSRELESPSGLLRRVRAVRLLADAALGPEYWPALEPLIYDSDYNLVAEACLLALRIAPENVCDDVVKRLFKAMDFVDWFVKTEIEDTLCEQFAKVNGKIGSEIDRRRHLLEPHFDPGLPVLLAVERRVTGAEAQRPLRK
jgi:hypothetical protein